MTVKTILSAKGGDVISIEPTATLETAVKTLAKHRIGALLVLGPDRRVIGILSERDIVRVLGEQGADVLAQPLAQVMTRNVVAPPARNGARVRSIARLYPNSVKDDRPHPTNGRARHCIACADTWLQSGQRSSISCVRSCWSVASLCRRGDASSSGICRRY